MGSSLPRIRNRRTTRRVSLSRFQATRSKVHGERTAGAGLTAALVSAEEMEAWAELSEAEQLEAPNALEPLSSFETAALKQQL